MARLSERDDKRASEMIAAIDEPSSASVVDAALPMLRDLLGARFTGSYGVRTAEDGRARADSLTFCGLDRAHSEVAGAVASFFRRIEARRGSPGMAPHFIVVTGSRGDRVRFGIERARHRWNLTEKETEVLAQLASGRSNRDIAERLRASERTVELHVSRILGKAYADTRSQLPTLHGPHEDPRVQRDT